MYLMFLVKLQKLKEMIDVSFAIEVDNTPTVLSTKLNCLTTGTQLFVRSGIFSLALWR